jgi:hypothetical protein
MMTSVVWKELGDKTKRRNRLVFVYKDEAVNFTITAADQYFRMILGDNHYHQWARYERLTANI